MATSGSFSNYITEQLGLCCEWTARQYRAGLSSDITVSVYLRHKNAAVHKQGGSISINGAVAGFVSPEIDSSTYDEWSNTLIGAHTVTVVHNEDGTKNGVPLSVSWNFYGTFMGEICEGMLSASAEIDLDAIEIYTLSINGDDHATATAERVSSGATTNIGIVENGGPLYYGDRLKVFFTAAEDYRVNRHTVNGSTFVDGGILVVDGDVHVEVSSEVVVKQAFITENMRCYDGSGRPLRVLYQWDKNVSITIKDVAISPPPTFQFSNRLSNETIDVGSEIDGNDLVVPIPNELLERPEAIFAYIRIGAGRSAKTLGSIYIPVRARQKPGAEYNEQEVR